MRFSSRTTWQIGAIILGLGFLGACSSSEEEEGISEPIAAESADTTEAAVPPPAPVAPESQTVEPVSEPATSAAPPATVGGSATRRVMYVKANGTAVREKADAKSRVLSKLNRGDHILVTIEGDWAHTDEGGYIAMKGLSEKGIGRTKGSVRWSGGNSGAVKGPKVKKPAKQPAKTPDGAPPVNPTPPPSADSPAGAGVAPDSAPQDDAGAEPQE